MPVPMSKSKKSLAYKGEGLNMISFADLGRASFGSFHNEQKRISPHHGGGTGATNFVMSKDLKQAASYIWTNNI